MGTHMAGWFESIDQATLGRINVVQDDVLTPSGADRFLVPDEYNWIHWAIASGDALTRAKIVTPSLEVAKTDFGAINPQPPEAGALTNAQLGHVLENEEVFTSWLKSIKGLALQKLERGEHVPGFKLVKKKANRVWKDIGAAENVLENFSIDFYEKKILSPAKIEKLITNKASIEHLITKPNNGNTIASEDDRRKAVVASAITDFERK